MIFCFVPLKKTNKTTFYLKVKVSPKCNQGFFCECIIMTKEALLRFTDPKMKKQ